MITPIINRLMEKRDQFISEFRLPPDTALLHPDDFNDFINEAKEKWLHLWCDTGGNYKFLGMDMMSTYHVSVSEFKVAKSGN